jgi:hypothetical protein
MRGASLLLLGAAMVLTIASANDQGDNVGVGVDPQPSPSTLSNVRDAFRAGRRIADALSDLLPNFATLLDHNRHDLGQLPVTLLGGATARGKRGTQAYSAPAKAAHAQATAEAGHTFEHAAARHLEALFDDPSAWWVSPDEDHGNTAADRKKAAPTTGATMFDVGSTPQWLRNRHTKTGKSLSRLHLRAAEVAGAARRRDHAVATTSLTTADLYGNHEDTYESSDPVTVAARKERTLDRLVTSLATRRLQQSHNTPPNIAPQYLPKSVRRYSLGYPAAASATAGSANHPSNSATSYPPVGNARRTFHAEQAAGEPKFEYCQDGQATYPAATNFSCVTDDSSPNSTILSAAQVAVESPEVRRTCEPVAPYQRACLCPRDSIIGHTSDGDTVCFWRNVECTVERLLPEVCPEPPANQPFRITDCVRVPRASQLAIMLNVSCRWQWANPIDYAFYGIEIVAEPSSDSIFSPRFLALDIVNTSVPIKNDFNESVVAPFGTYDELSNSLFQYPVEPATSVMPLTVVHPLVASVFMYARPVNFNRISQRDLQQSLALSSESYVAGQIVGQVPVVFDFSLADVGNEYLHANRLYIEAGIHGSGRNINPYDVMSVPFTIDFTDVPLPPLQSAERNTTTIILVAVLVPVGVLIIIGGIVGYCCYKRKKLERARQKRAEEKAKFE